MSISFDLDVTSILEGDEAEDYCCERLGVECSNEAVYRARMRSAPVPTDGCECHRVLLLCLPCYEQLTSSPSGFVLCVLCDGFAQISHVEKIRMTR